MVIACARYVMQHLRPYDKVFRYGGDESRNWRPTHWLIPLAFGAGARGCYNKRFPQRS